MEFKSWIKENVRSQFQDYYKLALKEIISLGITPAQIEILKKYGLLAKDNVTDFYEGRTGEGRYKTVTQAIQHVKETNEPCFYIEMDLKNLGGLNATLGHSGANVIFKKIAKIIEGELKKVSHEHAFFRHGGDEMSAILINSNKLNIINAMNKVNSLIQELSLTYEINKIPHAKGKDSMGIGIYYGIAEILPIHEQNPKEIFTTADKMVENNKKNLPL
jgi:diguanylate cyclase (GGDEF)-like protein